MPPVRTDFIGFILDAETNMKLAAEFFSKNTATDLLQFFSDNGYNAINTVPDCEAILKARKGVQGVCFASGAPFDCPDKGY